MTIRSKIRGEGATTIRDEYYLPTGRTKVESLEYEKGHKNSRGEDAPWVIRDHKGGKVLASFSNKKDAEAHLERMKHYAKEALSRHEVLDTAGFSRFVRSLMDAALDRFDDATWDRIVKDYDFGDDFEKGRSVPDTISRLQGWVAATEKMDNSKSEKLFSVPELEQYAMENYMKAVDAAFEKAGVKNFKIALVMRKSEKPHRIDVYPVTPSGTPMDISWRILPDTFTVAQYSTDRNGSDTAEREMPFKDDSDIEGIFLDEFKTLDEVLAEGKPSEACTDEAHKPGTKWSDGIRVAFYGENDPNDKWIRDYEGQSVWNFFDDLSDTLPPREALKCVPERYKDAFKDYCIYYGMKWPEEPRECKSEAVINRITMHDARKKCAALQKSGKLSNCLQEVSAAISLVQNALANGSPEVKDNALNSVEKKIVARAVLAEIISNFNFQPEDLR